MFLGIVLLLASVAPAEREVAPPPREIPNVAHERPRNYVGEVMAITKDSVTIRGRQHGNKGPDVIGTFMASDYLAKGEDDPNHYSNSNYRLSDVKVGDTVVSIIGAKGDDDICLTIKIRRRPDGLVPPAPFEPGDAPHKYHNDMNAYQAHEERGVPLPLRLNEDYQRWLSEWFTNEHRAFRKQQERIAPPPRPVIRK